jgi:glycosyltransferase involved in cell wall biosynthesis
MNTTGAAPEPALALTEEKHVATFSIILATIGRPAVRRTIASIAPQLLPGDEVIIIRDDSGDAGDTPRNDAMPRARGTHLLFMDDDDVYRPNALAAMRRFAEENPGRIGIFRLQYAAGNRRWVDPVLRYKNVSTQTFVVPNVPGKLARWQRQGRTEGDFCFIEATVKLQGEPIFVDEVTVLVRPRNPIVQTWIRARYRAALRTRARRILNRLRRTGRTSEAT